MIPVKADSNEGWAPLCLFLVIAMTLITGLLSFESGDATGTFRDYGLVPTRLFSSESWALLGVGQQLVPLLSHIFLHDGWLHCLINVWWLWLFGAPIERAVGTGQLAIFVVGVSLVSALAHAGMRAHAVAPLIGASGLVAGLMGAYLRVMPRGQLLLLIPTAMPWTIRVHAGWFAGAWILLQLVLAVSARGFESDIAWWVHIVGFILGMSAGGFLTVRAPASSVQTDA